MYDYLGTWTLNPKHPYIRPLKGPTYSVLGLSGSRKMVVVGISTIAPSFESVGRAHRRGRECGQSSGFTLRMGLGFRV